MNASQPPLKRPRSSGFHAQVDGASLVELIQLNCLGRQRAAFEVSSGTQRGLLFFEDGRVIHAEFAGEEGISAVQRMLALDSGRFRPSHAGWPRSETISVPWEALVLRAAQANDEAQAPPSSAAGEIVEFPGVNKTMHEESSSRPRSAAVQLSATGDVISHRGDCRALADAAAYLVQVGDAIGEVLGLGALLELDASATDVSFSIFREENGGAFAAKGSASELDGIKQKRRRG